MIQNTLIFHTTTPKSFIEDNKQSVQMIVGDVLTQKHNVRLKNCYIKQ